jgi:hypothetical protein
MPNASLAGNIWLIGVFGDNEDAPTWSATDENFDIGTLINHGTDSNGNWFGIFRLAPTTGSKIPTIKQTNETEGFVTVSVAEYYNLGATDVSACNAGTRSTSITSGSITPTTSGDLLWQYAGNNNGPQLTTLFTAGSQSNINWKLIGTDMFSGDGGQWGVYSSTTAINPTFTGQSEGWDSCTAAIKAVSAGTAPSVTPRVLYTLHAQGGSNTAITHQFNGSGNNDLMVLSYNSGGQTVTVNSTPSNTWSSAYATTGSPDTSQIQYVCNAATANSMQMALTYSAASDSTSMISEVTGAATSSCLDASSGGQIGDQTSIVTSLTTCSSCITTVTANDIVFGNANWDFCTATASPTPSGSNFDSAIYTDNNLDGPETVDQNGGWWHQLIASPSTLSTTWTMSCASTAESHWAGGVAAFKGAPSNGQLLPPTGVKAVVQ